MLILDCARGSRGWRLSERIGQGRENAKLFLKDNPTVMAEIEEKVKAVLGINKIEAGQSEAAEE